MKMRVLVVVALVATKNENESTGCCSTCCANTKLFVIQGDRVMHYVDPNCRCVFDDMYYDFKDLTDIQKMKWFKAVKCRMIQRASMHFTPAQVGLISMMMMRWMGRDFWPNITQYRLEIFYVTSRNK